MVALETGAACFATVGTALPLGRAVRARRLEARSVAALHEASVHTLLAVEVLLLWVIEVAGKRVERDARVASGKHAFFAARDQVLTVEAPVLRHEVALLAKAGTRERVGELVATLFAAFADAPVDVEVVAHTAETLVS